MDLLKTINAYEQGWANQKAKLAAQYLLKHGMTRKERGAYVTCNVAGDYWVRKDALEMFAALPDYDQTPLWGYVIYARA